MVQVPMTRARGSEAKAKRLRPGHGVLGATGVPREGAALPSKLRATAQEMPKFTAMGFGRRLGSAP